MTHLVDWVRPNQIITFFAILFVVTWGLKTLFAW